MAGIDSAIGPAGVKFYFKADADLPDDSAKAVAIASAANLIDDVIDSPPIGGSPNILNYATFGTSQGKSVGGIAQSEQLSLQGEAKSSSVANSVAKLAGLADGTKGIITVALVNGAKATYFSQRAEKAASRIVPSTSDVQRFEVTFAMSGAVAIVDKAG